MAYLEQTQLTDEKDFVVNPASEESIILLRRMAKILENQQAVDAAQRQRIVVDSGTITLGAGVASVGNVSTVATVTTVTSVTNIVGLFSWNQQILLDPARTAYNTGIRSQLTFS
jgi:predicted RNA binding protein with dsRBD fold (UPF0201 family)